MQLSPAQYVIYVFGGVNATARAIRRNQATVSRWRISKRKGGTGGFIPYSSLKRVLKAAKDKSLDLKAADLILGRRVRKDEYKEHFKSE